MLHSTKRRLLLMMTTSIFVTIGMLAYSCDNGYQTTLQTSDHHLLYLRQMDIFQGKPTRPLLPEETAAHLKQDTRSDTSSSGSHQHSVNQTHYNNNNNNNNDSISSSSLSSSLSSLLSKVGNAEANNDKNSSSKTLKVLLRVDGNEQPAAVAAAVMANVNGGGGGGGGGGGNKNADVVTSLPQMEERRNHIKSVCSANVKMSTLQRPATEHVLYNAKYQFYYCPVEKVASTFWRRFIYQLHHTNPVKSPFDVPILTALVGMRNLHLPAQQRSGTELDKVLAQSTKLLFVRDPHSRIFSAFVDKLLAPNPYYWKVWALPAIIRYRPNHHGHGHNGGLGHAHCGHDIKFDEFVKYVINVAFSKDVHVMPINVMCSPCAVPYTVVGKMETFSDDMKLVFDFLHVNTTPLRMESMKQETTLDAIADSATDALSGSWLTSSLRCISKEAVLQRIWRKSQIRGFVSWRQNMHLSAQEIQFMKSKDFIKLLNDASRLSTDKNELKIQKTQAMKEAFALLDKSALLDINKVYEDDLKLFEYSENPSWLQDIHLPSFTDTKAFDYSKPWDLSTLVDSTTTGKT